MPFYLSDSTWRVLGLSVAASYAGLRLFEALLPHRAAAVFLGLPNPAVKGTAPVKDDVKDDIKDNKGQVSEAVSILLPLLGVRDLSIAAAMFAFAYEGKWQEVGPSLGLCCFGLRGVRLPLFLGAQIRARCCAGALFLHSPYKYCLSPALPFARLFAASWPYRSLPRYPARHFYFPHHRHLPRPRHPRHSSHSHKCTLRLNHRHYAHPVCSYQGRLHGGSFCIHLPYRSCCSSPKRNPQGTRCGRSPSRFSRGSSHRDRPTGWIRSRVPWCLCQCQGTCCGNDIKRTHRYDTGNASWCCRSCQTRFRIGHKSSCPTTEGSQDTRWKHQCPVPN